MLIFPCIYKLAMWRKLKFYGCIIYITALYALQIKKEHDINTEGQIYIYTVWNQEIKEQFKKQQKDQCSEKLNCIVVLAFVNLMNIVHWLLIFWDQNHPHCTMCWCGMWVQIPWHEVKCTMTIILTCILYDSSQLSFGHMENHVPVKSKRCVL